jgi:predicted GNAT family acetyltransferase
MKRDMVTVNHDPGAHQFTADIDGHRAVLNYTLADGVMTITYIGVPQPVGGRGVAAELMRAALSEAKAESWLVNPSCSYAAAYMRRHHPDAADKQHVDDLLDEALEESFPASDSSSVGGST